MHLTVDRAAVVALVAALLCAGAAPAVAADIEAGRKAFAKCAACHALEPGKHKVGPSLHGVFGRVSGTASGFAFSQAMRKAKVTWSDKTFAAYLHAPKDFVKDNKMAFVGIKDDAEIAALAAYIKAGAQR
ncbi:MAG: c-type cytochrome [Alphaproteobacteria bacterium]|nr:c-type cytochrome [Alphaproteobacteria bacterium]